MTKKSRQQKLQMPIPGLLGRSRGEASKASQSGEALPATKEPSDLGTSRLMERVVERKNMKTAWKRVKANKGKPGVDGMSIDEAVAYLTTHWDEIKEALLNDKYQPAPTRTVLIPKDGGKFRTLGIPTVCDRLIQQALLQCLQPIFDPTFSDHSHGFRPGKSPHTAIAEARNHVLDGATWTVDVDLSKFFDRVDHDILMSRVTKRVEDKRVLRLIGRYLRAPTMNNGKTTPRRIGTPQGGPLSPLLANILLDEVDKDLESRGHSFVRYADDLRVFTRSRRAALRIMSSLQSRFAKLKLVVNEEKSAVAPSCERPFLGFRLTKSKKHGIGLMPTAKAFHKIKEVVRAATRRNRGRNVDNIVDELRPKLSGWLNYYRTPFTAIDPLRRLDGWVRRRFRALILSQWKTCKNATRKLRALGKSDKAIAGITRYWGRWWYAAGFPSNRVLPTRFFDKLRLPRFVT